MSNQALLAYSNGPPMTQDQEPAKIQSPINIPPTGLVWD